MRFLKSNALSILALLTMICLSLYYYDGLPESIATKFDFSGNPTQHSPKVFIVILMPMIFAGLMALINILVKVSPHKFSMPNSKRAMDIIVFGSGLLLLGIHLGMIVDPGGQASFAKYFSWGMALFLIVVGNVFGKTERNFFMGIRVPWTILTEANWKATHRFAGKLMVIFGIILGSSSNSGAKRLMLGLWMRINNLTRGDNLCPRINLSLIYPDLKSLI